MLAWTFWQNTGQMIPFCNIDAQNIFWLMSSGIDNYSLTLGTLRVGTAYFPSRVSFKVLFGYKNVTVPFLFFVFSLLCPILFQAFVLSLVPFGSL